MTIRLLLADDQALVRQGFRALLEVQDDMEVVGEAGDGAEALAVARQLRPDVVLMDIRMPVMDGLEATRHLLATADPPRVLILTTFDMDDYVFRALRAGASGFLLKDASAPDLLAAIRIVAAGDALLAPSVTRRLVAEFVRQPPSSQPPSSQPPSSQPPPGQPPPGQLTPSELERLTGREVDVLRLVAAGRSNAEIAGELVVAEQTVKSHVSRVLAKLGLRDRTQAVVVAYESGLIVPGSVQRP